MTRDARKDRKSLHQVSAVAMAAGPSSGIPQDVLQDFVLLQSLAREVHELRDLVQEKQREATRIGTGLQLRIKQLGLDFARAEAAAMGGSVEAAGCEVRIEGGTK